jgi:hypothetical protein
MVGWDIPACLALLVATHTKSCWRDSKDQKERIGDDLMVFMMLMSLKSGTCE